MYIIAIVAEKGGAGKTTIALELAVAATKEGHKVAILDVDPQATASKWTDRRIGDEPWVVPTHGVRIAATIEQAKKQGVDFIVIDTPPHSSTEAAEAARRCDVVISPVEPHLFGLETMAKLSDLLKIAGTPPAIVVVNKAPTQGTEGADAAEAVTRQGFTVAPVIFHYRAAHRHSTNIGKVAIEFEAKGKAAQESLQLYAYTVQVIDKQRKAHAKAESTHARA